MKIVQLVLNIFKRHKLLNILLLLELVLTFIMINILLNRVSQSSIYIDMINKAKIDNSIYFMGRVPIYGKDVLIYNYSYEKEMNDYLSNLNGYIGKSDIEDYMLTTNDNEELYITSYDNITSTKFKNKLKKGMWFTDKKVKDGNIPCVIIETTKDANTYKIGQQIKGKINYLDENQTEYKEINLEVTGIVNKDYANLFYPSMQISNYVVEIETMFAPLSDNTITIITGEIDGLKRNKDKTGILYLDNNLSYLENEKISKKLDEFGYNNTIAESKNKSEELLFYRIRNDLPIFIAFLSISTIGLISISFLNTKRQFKIFSIYYLCGCTKRKSIVIYALYFMTIIFIAFLLYIVSMNILYSTDNRGVYYLYIIEGRNIEISLLICFVLTFITTAIPFIRNKKYSPINIFKEN